ncbi:hypothetical protein J437_LFUL002510 [Ladona fulva]|uniref:S-adenosylmethionine sensor upstream of mTORC1 n=1 Tax=Ladona fulva TaxID=123851 RepID=A0A8K0KRV1_LADFU|nr:hypothetical protein J437_LFUL002510 [Ladona fulva]
MATPEHLTLSSIIKSVHQNLRVRSRVIGSDLAWEEHRRNKELLKEYAAAMHKLATEHWKDKSEDNINCRIDWVAKQSQSYFIEGGHAECYDRELQKLHRLNCSAELGEDSLKYTECNGAVNFNTPLSMLDVGSCYNPYKIFPFFNTFPIDLAPATEDVLSCDFLKVNVSETDKAVEDFVKCMKYTSSSDEMPEIKFLPAEFFDVINFSLFLEYLPSSKQRYSSCKKAYDLLRLGGVLFVITPDSKHQSANAPLMRNWRIALETIGFLRISYQKLTHLHCMAFRKCPFPDLPKTFAKKELSRFEKFNKLTPPEMMVIPQDFSACTMEAEKTDSYSLDKLDTENVNYFTELPVSF